MICDKLTKKIVLVLIFVLISCIIFTSTVYAGSLDSMISSADDFLKTGQDNAILTGPDSPLSKTSEYIYNTLLVIAVAIAVIVGTYLGIKFMMESAEDKAKIKEALIPFIVGCFVIFGAFGIWKIAVNVGTSISGDTTYSGESYQQAADNSWDLIEGNTGIDEFSDSELKSLFSHNGISSDIYYWTSDSRNPNKVSTVSEAVKKMSEYKQKIYNKCKERGLLNSNGTGLK